jgi:outer membrane protein assembly factor BamB
MQNNGTGTTAAPGPDCARFAPYLPLLESGELAATEAEATRAHVVGCTWCQRRLTSYATVDAALRRQLPVADHANPITTMEEIMRQTAPTSGRSDGNDSPGRNDVRVADRGIPRAQRRVLPGVASIAAVLLIAVVAAALFASHGGRPSTTVPVTLSPTLSPALATRTVYVGVNGSVLALRASDGHQLWHSQRLSGDSDAPSLAVADGVVYAVEQATVTALRTSDGSVLWAAAIPTGVYVLTVADGVVYVAPWLQSIESLGQHFATAQDRPHPVYALRASDGRELWTFHAADIIVGAPAAANGVVYVATMTQLDALKAADGSILWQSPLGVSATQTGQAPLIVGTAGISVSGAYVYVNARMSTLPNPDPNQTSGSELWILRASDGEHMIRQESTGLGFVLQAFPPVVSNGVVYTQHPDGLVAYSADPTVHSLVRLYHLPAAAPARYVAGPALLGEALYANGDLGYLCAFRASDASSLWQAQLQSGTVAGDILPPVAGDGAVFALGGGVVFAFQANTGRLAWQVTAGPKDSTVTAYAGPVLA